MPLIPCGVALIRRGQDFLIAQRKKDDSFGLYWEFPGGKRDPDETFEQCIVREIMEETGVRIRVEKKFMEIKKKYNQNTIWLNFYLCSYISGEAQPLDCEKVLWAPLNELMNYKFPPANERVIKKLKETYRTPSRGEALHG